MEEDPTCPICFELIADPPEENIQNHKISATVPCGHLFHQHCIHKWLHSSHTSTKKCPTCNLRFERYVDLFVNPSNFRGGIAADDDISLSSSEEEEEAEEKEDVDQEKEKEDDIDQDCENDDDGRKVITEQGKEIIDLCDDDENDDVATGAGAAIESLPISSQVPSTTTKKSTLKRRSTGREQGGQSLFGTPTVSIDDNDQSEIQRLTRIAKNYKKRFVQKEKESRQQHRKIITLTQQLQDREEEVGALEKEADQFAAQADEATSSLDRCRHKLLKATQDRDLLREESERLKKEKQSTISRLEHLQKCYKRDLDDVRGNSMVEVREMREQMKEMQQTIEQLRQQQKGEATEHGATNSAKARTQLIKEFSNKINSKRRLPSSPVMNNPYSTQKTGDTHLVRKVSTARYSSNAARLMGAASQQRERKFSSLESNAIVRGMVLPPAVGESVLQRKQTTLVGKRPSSQSTSTLFAKKKQKTIFSRF
jgi:Ring finger domain